LFQIWFIPSSAKLRRRSVATFPVKHVELLGFKGKVNWTQDEKGLTVQLPQQKPSDHAIAFKLLGA
jgi:alpha-L-fucosidase